MRRTPTSPPPSARSRSLPTRACCSSASRAARSSLSLPLTIRRAPATCKAAVLSTMWGSLSPPLRCVYSPFRVHPCFVLNSPHVLRLAADPPGARSPHLSPPDFSPGPAFSPRPRSPGKSGGNLAPTTVSFHSNASIHRMMTEARPFMSRRPTSEPCPSSLARKTIDYA